MLPSSLLSTLRKRASGLVFLLLALSPCAYGASRPAATGIHGMVVSPEPLATQIGLDTLRGGGNVIDASIAVSFALAVTYPQAGNLGGGGFLLYRNRKGRFFALDHRETAPAGLRSEQFLDPGGKPVPGRSLRTGLAVGVPGSPAGLLEAHRRWGKRPWKELVEPARRLAADGFPLSRAGAESLNRMAERFRSDPEAAAVFLRPGRPWKAGDRFIQKNLAATLERIASGKKSSFYEGPIARAIVRKVQAAGGVMTLEDLAGYSAVMRKPIQGNYKQYRVTSFPPPSSGGIILLQILKMLEPFDLASSGFGSSRTVHLIVEAERRSYADRARWMGDPDFFQVPVKELLSDAYISDRRSSIDPQKATPSARILPMDPPPPESRDTLHFTVADGEGAVVAVTTTLNSLYGSGIVAGDTGILLNNEIDDFALAPGVPNQFGLVGGDANSIRGGKRPLSSMTPTIVEDRSRGGRPVLALGSPGGATIITSVLQVLLNVLEYKMPLQAAVDAPRFHHQWLPDEVRYEPFAFPADVRDALIDAGHTLVPLDRYLGNVAAVAMTPGGVLQGAADPRGQGTAEAY